MVERTHEGLDENHDAGLYRKCPDLFAFTRLRWPIRDLPFAPFGVTPYADQSVTSDASRVKNLRCPMARRRVLDRPCILQSTGA
jgi:hypothetical protein